MRTLAYFFVLTTAFGQTPTVRDAYVQAGDPRIASLKDYLNVVVCKTEYDTWRKDPKSVPALSLYINGLLMKGLEAARPVPATIIANDKQTDAVKKDQPRKDKVRADCNNLVDNVVPAALSAAEKDAADKAAAAKEASAKAASEADPIKKAVAVKDASDKDALAREAGTKAATMKASPQPSGDPRYVFQYYLDSQFVTNPDTKGPWIRLLERPWRSQELLPVSVGPPDGPPWPTEAAIHFRRITLTGFVGWAALFVLAVGLFVRYAAKSDIIRDSGELTGGKKAFSLARTQMAVWTFLVAGALAFLFMVTWNENNLSTGILVLLGLSFGTTLLAATADRASPSAADIALAEKDAADKAAAAKEASAKAASEADPINKAVAVKDASDKAYNAKTAADNVAALKTGVQPPQATSGRFLTDLLTEGSGPSFHRYQMVLFTVILAAIFVIKTATALVMPEFDATLLGLMGISSGTYLGFKLQGK